MKKQVSAQNVGQCGFLHAASSYEAPATWRNSVETEGGICTSVLDDDRTTNDVHANDHNVQIFDDDDPFNYSEREWD